MAPITIPAVGLVSGIVGVILRYGIESFENIIWISFLWGMTILIPAALLGLVIFTIDCSTTRFNRFFKISHWGLMIISSIAGFIFIPEGYII
jgi:hypothetical protein